MEAVTVKSDICWNDDDVTTEIHGDEWEMENIEKKAAGNVQNCAVIVFVLVLSTTVENAVQPL